MDKQFDCRALAEWHFDILKAMKTATDPARKAMFCNIKSAIERLMRNLWGW
jgi:hypothetical protein